MRYFEVVAALGTAYVAGALAIPLILAGFAINKAREVGTNWSSDTFVLVIGGAAILSAVLLWTPKLIQSSKCNDLATGQTSDGRNTYSISDFAEARQYGCLDSGSD